MPTSKHEQGQGLIEYALILSLVGIVVIGILTLLGPGISELYNEVVCQLHNLKPGDTNVTAPDCSSSVADGSPPPPPPPPVDTDGDGIPDSSDSCPTEHGMGRPDGCPLQPPGAVNITYAKWDQTSGTVTIRWNAMTDADQYTVMIRTITGVVKASMTVTCTSSCQATLTYPNARYAAVQASNAAGTGPNTPPPGKWISIITL